MWDALTWRGLREPAMADAVAQLRDEALRFLLALSAVAYCLWQFFATTEASQEEAVQTWSVFPFVAAWLLGTYHLHRRGSRLAVPFFLAAAQVAVAAVVWLVQALKQLDQAYYRLQQANAALELAWKAAEAAERAKSEFVTNISHELRTPLNLIVGFSEMILASPRSYGQPLPADHRGDLTAIYRSSQHLLTMTNDVIDMARVGTGRLPLAREPVDLARSIADATEMVREYVAAKGLALRVELAEELPLLSLDRLRIRQVLLNLLTNAARFTEKGGITVSARPDGASVVVRVEDTGRGIPPDELPKVFDEFYHGDDGEAPFPGAAGGFGLGLPISRRLIELHGGAMGVESTVGRGTAFWFTLPVGAALAGATGDGHAVGLVRPGPALERELIVVTPEPGLADLVRRHVHGYHVVAAASCAKAVAHAKRSGAAAILADDSPAAAGELARAPVPVLRLPLPHGERLAESLGAAAQIVKPVTRATLEQVVRRLPAGKHPRSVLVVDDDARFVRLMTLMLRAAGLGDGEVARRTTGARRCG